MTTPTKKQAAAPAKKTSTPVLDVKVQKQINRGLAGGRYTLVDGELKKESN